VHLSAKPATWRIAGLRTGLDGFSTTGPNPDGSRIADVTVDCLKEAKLKAADIELIKLQAAGSPGTDLAEANALRTVFGQQMPPLISLKPGLGHTLGASGLADSAPCSPASTPTRFPPPPVSPRSIRNRPVP
jgi:3-oxoacyl-[acyl-carrier-protein] synthase-1